VCDPSEQLTDLTQRRLVSRAAGQHGGVPERRGDRRLGGLGHEQQRAARTRRRLELGLPVHRGHQHARVEAQGVTGVGALAHPALGDAARRGPHPERTDHAVAVVDVIAYPRRGQRQRHHGGQPHTVTRGHVRAPHAAQWARPGRPARGLRDRLRLDQQGNH
jgi:hypothetical protein